MKKMALISLSVLLTACASGTYTSNVNTESQREEYKTEPVSQPIIFEDSFTEQALADTFSQKSEETLTIEEQLAVEAKPVVNVTPQENTKPVIKMNPKTEPKPVVSLAPPAQKQTPTDKQYGYTIQVAALGSQAKIAEFARTLGTGDQPIWENYKVQNGNKWYTLLYGDYATRAEAQAAIAELPAQFKALKPFIKSIDAIKNSDYPSLNQLN